MKEYYLDRLHWIFCYRSKNFWYCLSKTLCLIVGVPVYAVSFAVEMILTFINMLFSWIPFLSVVMTVLCKVLITVFGSLFYINILPDLRAYRLAHNKPSVDSTNEDSATEELFASYAHTTDEPIDAAPDEENDLDKQ